MENIESRNRVTQTFTVTFPSTVEKDENQQAESPGGTAKGIDQAMIISTPLERQSSERLNRHS